MAGGRECLADLAFGACQTYAALQVPVICSRIPGSVAAQFEALRASRLGPKLRRETVDLHLGVLVFGVRSHRTFNDLAHCRH
jgi:hypothetical protein